jgi:dienelactone hydrolase
MIALLLAGCMHYPRVEDSRLPGTVDPTVEGYYSYAKRDIVADIKVTKETRKYVLKEVVFDLVLPADFVSTEPLEELRERVKEMRDRSDEKGARKTEIRYTVRMDYYEAKGEGKKPVIIVSPILGGNMIVNWFASFFASHGMHAAIVHREKPKYDPTQPLTQAEAGFRKSVIRTRQALDWLLAQPNVDAEKAGSFGISYGALVNTLVAAVEPRLKCHILALAGGPISDLLLDSEERAIKKYVRSAATDAGYDIPRLREDLRKVIRSDTLAMAPYIAADDVILIIALFDRVVRRPYSENLRRALGYPEVIYTPVGHYSTVLAIPYLKTKALRFYRAKFYPEPPPGNRGILYSRESA